MSSFLRSFTDKAPYIKEDIDFKSLGELQDLAIKNGASLFISTTPINSGTLALVFKGELIIRNEKRNIAVKVLRCGIRNKIQSALQNIEWLFNILKYVPYINKLNLHSVIVDVKDELLQQVQFSNEVKNINHVYKITKTYKSIRQPQTIPFLCTENCITMDFMPGSNILALDIKSRESFVETMVMTFIYFTFKKQIFHLDCHPGNVLFNKDDMTICFLDLGMMMKLTSEEADFFYEIIIAVYNDCTNEECINSFVKCAKNVFINHENIKETLESIFSRHNLFKQKQITDITRDIGILLYELDTTKNKLNPTMHKLLVGFISFLGFCDIMDGNKMLFRNVFLKVMNNLRK
jgi:predicted unusual protein kinase regulating ubiquinone biosynthesis (AarF/ABC1/UbiB family)